MSSLGAKLLAVVREADWLHGRRAHAYSIIFALVTAVALVGWASQARGGLDPLGKPLGTDFTSFWAASKMALEGRPADVYIPRLHNAVQQAMFGGKPIGYAAFFYPPIYLLLCLPLALLPYLQALTAWLSVSGLAYWKVVKQTWGTAGRTIPILAFPAVVMNIAHGQNAFFTAALFGAGALFLNRRPLLAGVCFGALIFKPQLGILIPVALLAAGRWRTIFAAGATVVGLGLASLAAFGLDTWRGFFKISGFARRVLEEGLVGPEKMPTVFAAARMWDFPVAAAYTAQAIMTAVAAVLLVLVARKARDPEALGPAMIAAAMLASPFMLDYDLVLLALPMVWLLSRGNAGGFLPWEKAVLGLAFVLPLYTRPLARLADLPVGPPILLLVLLLVVRRALHPRASAFPEEGVDALGERGRDAVDLHQVLDRGPAHAPRGAEGVQ